MAYESFSSMRAAIRQAVETSDQGLTIRQLYRALQCGDMTLFRMVLVDMLGDGEIECRLGRFLP